MRRARVGGTGWTARPGLEGISMYPVKIGVARHMRLTGHGLVLGVRSEEFLGPVDVEVGDTNRSGQTLVDELKT